LFRPRLGIADWTFSHLAFPEFVPDHNEYLNLVMKMNEVYNPVGRNELEQLLWSVRENAEAFIDELSNQILEYQPKIVGCSSTFCQHAPSLALLRRIRDLAPEVTTIIGGANCETMMGRSTHALFPWLDYVVSGEADGIIVALTRAILDKGREVPVTELPVGVFAPVHRQIGYPVDNSKQSDGVPRAITLSLEDYPVPNYDDFVQTCESAVNIRDTINPGMTVESSRGCWWGQRKGCVFCGFNGKGMKFRSKDPEKFVDEIATLHNRYGIDGIETVDNILDMNYLKTALPMITEAGSQYRLYYEIKSNLQRRHVKILREAGVIWVQTGIESLNSNILKLMNKGCKAYQNIQLLKWLREYGIRVHWNMLYDFPGDHDDWYEEMVELVPKLYHLQSPVKMAPLEFCRFSVYHENQEHYGLKLRASEAFKYVYPLGGKDLDDLVYFFEDELRSAHERNPILACLVERPVFRVLKRKVEAWRDYFWYEKASLTMQIVEDALILEDTRPVAKSSSHEFSGIRKDIYLAADGAPEKQSLVKQFSSDGISRTEVEEICSEFVAQQIAVEIDGRLLALAVRAPLPELPTALDYPGGVVVHKEYSHLIKQAAR
jgi:ribosomal peptide maturation radical SAM protein 1